VIDVLIVRDPRESTKKCSLTPLRGAASLRFVGYDAERRVDAGVRTWLHPEGDLLTRDDAGRGLLLIDCAWRRVAQLRRTIDGELVPRRLPALRTAYPRVSREFQDPEAGLASVEALYAALALLGEPRPELLVGYRWAREFFELNPELRAAER
jgi:pre-rRNA-processing protein TSR3